MGPVTGLDLKVERIRIRPRVSQADLGAAMVPPVGGSRIAAIERELAPDPDLVKRYRAALESAVLARAERQGAA